MPTLCITWWTSGLWEAIVRQFIIHDRHVVALARNEQKLKTLQHELWTHFDYRVCDIRDQSQLIQVFTTIDTIDCFINNSGVGYRKHTDAESLHQIQDTIQTNLISAIRCTKLVLPKMITQQDGVVINIWSMQSTKWKIGASTYGASKAGLKMYTDILREEVKQYNIKVISIHPWKIETPMRDKDELEAFTWRMLQPQDVAKIVYDSYQKASQWIVQEEIYVKPQAKINNSQ